MRVNAVTTNMILLCVTTLTHYAKMPGGELALEAIKDVEHMSGVLAGEVDRPARQHH